jgi:DNA-binding response OmpR family regulator
MAMAHRLNDEAETLLVVDDDEAIRKLEVRMLSQLGHKVLEAEGPVEAMRLAAATPTIHLLLTDFSMPEANGLELARRFRAVHPKTPVLMVSGSLEAISRADGLDQFAVLAKPFTLEDLVHNVRTLLSGATDQHAVASP